MIELFDETRLYQPSDPEIQILLGTKEKQAQMRYYGRYPAFFRFGRKIVIHGKDLNSWANAQRVVSNSRLA
tara:strand:- start:980 stop:1192 length:213 start_codon:yes stop_codon:yes gene_type:complete